MDSAYWECPTSVPPKDVLYVVSVLVACFSLLLNLGLFVLLFLLRGKAMMFLVHLRALIAGAVLHSFIDVCNYLMPRRLFPTDSLFAPTLCHLWVSNYLPMVCLAFMALVLNFIVGNRAIQIACRYQYSFSTSLLTNLAYVVGMGLLSITVMLPQALIVYWDGKRCRCRDTNLAYGLLVSLYTETFVHFGLSVVISAIILGKSCHKIITWVRNTPADQLSDTWNNLAFSCTTKEQLETFSRPQGWMTASMCTLPLSVAYIIPTIFKSGNEFLCASGVCKLARDSLLFRVGNLLVDIQLLILPIIIIIFIPALRDLPVRLCQRTIWLIKEHCRTAPTEEVGFRIS
ncbi:hypothetical protein AAHC03_09387 [Spirometra sp. Aus1]